MANIHLGLWPLLEVHGATVVVDPGDRRLLHYARRHRLLPLSTLAEVRSSLRQRRLLGLSRHSGHGEASDRNAAGSCYRWRRLVRLHPPPSRRSHPAALPRGGRCRHAPEAELGAHPVASRPHRPRPGRAPSPYTACIHACGCLFCRPTCFSGAQRNLPPPSGDPMQLRPPACRTDRCVDRRSRQLTRLAGRSMAHQRCQCQSTTKRNILPCCLEFF